MNKKEFIDNFVEFDGRETEIEFLKKCLDQWELTNDVKSETQKLIMLGAMFSEMEHRVRDMEG